MSTYLHTRKGFTIIELMVVIGILVILAAIVIPALSRAQQASREAAGLSNLRQIMNATLSYMNDNNNRFPRALTSDQDKIYFYTELSPYLGKTNSVGATLDNVSKVFQDPAAAIKKGVNHFTMNANIGHYYNRDFRSQPTPLIFSTPSEVVVYFDGAQAYNGNVDTFGWAVDKGMLNGQNASIGRAGGWFGASYPDGPVDKGPNTDGWESRGNIRWRNKGDTAAKFAFLDGRVVLLKPGETKRRFFMLP